MSENNESRNKLMINSATSISLGKICWFGLDTKLVGKIKALLKEKERLNNIINELQLGIRELDDMFYETFRISQDEYYSISKWELKQFINKVKELKENK